MSSAPYRCLYSSKIAEMPQSPFAGASVSGVVQDISNTKTLFLLYGMPSLAEGSAAFFQMRGSEHRVVDGLLAIGETAYA
jgi:hypothetical protein